MVVTVVLSLTRFYWTCSRYKEKVHRLGIKSNGRARETELKAEQPEIKEENLETEEPPLELSEEAPAQEEPKSE